MKLFYTEEEALKDKLIYSKGQESFCYTTRLNEMPNDFIASLRGDELTKYKTIKSLYIRERIRRGKSVVLVVYVLEQLKEEAIKIILEAYSE